MQRNIVETILGAVVLLVACAFMFFFYRTTDIKPATGYEIVAEFSQVNGLESGSPVRVAGVRVGQVLDFALDKKSYRAVVRLNIDNGVQLPADTSATITSAGLLDGKFLTLEPGADEEMLKPGDKITLTQASPSLEQMLGKFIFAVTKEKDKMDGGAPNDSSDDDAAAGTPETPATPENATP